MTLIFSLEFRQDLVELLKDEIDLDPSVHDTNALKDITINSDNEAYINIDWREFDMFSIVSSK